jgi:hypothetical protein
MKKDEQEQHLMSGSSARHLAPVSQFPASLFNCAVFEAEASPIFSLISHQITGLANRI